MQRCCSEGQAQGQLFLVPGGIGLRRLVDLQQGSRFVSVRSGLAYFSYFGQRTSRNRVLGQTRERLSRRGRDSQTAGKDYWLVCCRLGDCHQRLTTTAKERLDAHCRRRWLSERDAFLEQQLFESLLHDRLCACCSRKTPFV